MMLLPHPKTIYWAEVVCFTHNEGKVILAFSPIQRTITFNKKQYFLSFPWMLFSINYLQDNYRCCSSSLSMGFADAPLEKWEDEVCLPPLPNVHDQGEVCLGLDNFCAQNLEQLIEYMLNRFWLSRFKYMDPNDEDEKAMLKKALKTWRDEGYAKIPQKCYPYGKQYRNAASCYFDIKPKSKVLFDALKGKS